jgi:cytochrome c oxidase subunit 2
LATLVTTPNFLHTAGSEADRIAGVWWLMFAMAAGVYLVVSGLILYGILRGRHRPDSPSQLKENHFIVIGGIIVPVIILAVVGATTVTTTAALRKPSVKPVRIEVVGKLWWWQVTYVDDGFTTANEMHIPAGQPVEIGLDSDNVIHSFWVPQLAGKMDTIPGQHNVLRFTANTTGTFPSGYRGECVEFCGIGHAQMAFTVEVDSPGDYGRWVARQQLIPAPPVSDEAALGQLVFNRQACAGCHTIRGTQAQGQLGPDLTDFGSRNTIGAGTLPNDPGQLSGWIANASAIKPGALMPPVTLTPAELHALVAYLEGLK